VLTIGLLHRGTEKLMEMRHLTTSVGYMDRLDYVSMLSNELCYAEVVEASTHVHVPLVVSSYRLMLQEVARVENHLLNIACHAGDLGCLLALLWLFEDRETLYDVLSTTSGARMHASSIVPGGVRCTGILHSSVELIEVMTTLGMRMDVLSVVLLSHRVWSTRLTGCGVLSYNALPMSGVMLRSTGIAWDARILACMHPAIPVGAAGDSMDRILQRCMEVLCTVSLTVRIVGTVTSAAASTVHSYSGLHGVLTLFMV